jgi:calcium-dependent protein kinase
VELGTMRQLDHPNIVKLFDIYDHEDEFIVIIELCKGGEVYSRIKNSRMSEARSAKIIKQALRGLIYIHSQNIIHRDINPHNLIFQDQARQVVKLIDFGFARKL